MNGAWQSHDGGLQLLLQCGQGVRGMDQGRLQQTTEVKDPLRTTLVT